MAFYETIYIVRPDLTVAQVELVTDKVKEMVAARNGNIVRTELWGRREMAYSVKKNTKGYYIFHILEGGGEMIGEIEVYFRLNEDVLKYLNVRVKESDFAPTPMAVAETPISAEPAASEAPAAAASAETAAPAASEEPAASEGGDDKADDKASTDDKSEKPVDGDDDGSAKAPQPSASSDD